MISNRLWKILVTFKSCKTLSATAERLFVSQPSISSSMKMLEKELGVQLFDRSKNKIVLNEVGLEAAQLAEDYLKREDFMVRQIQEKAWQMRTLTVASYIFNLRKDLVSRLSVLFPERNIISEQLSSEQLPLGLLQGRFDISSPNMKSTSRTSAAFPTSPINSGSASIRTTRSRTKGALTSMT